MPKQMKAEFKLVDSPTQMYAMESGDHLIVAPFEDEEGSWVALRIEWSGGEEGTTVHLTHHNAIRLAKRLLCAVDGNAEVGMFLEWEGDIQDRLFEGPKR